MQLPPGHTRVSAVATLEAVSVDLPEDILWGDGDDSVSRAIVKTIAGELHLFSGWYNRDNPEQVGRVAVQLLVRDPEARLDWIELHHEDFDGDCAVEDVFARCRSLQHSWPNLPASQPGDDEGGR
jgi:hypothetical protein